MLSLPYTSGYHSTGFHSIQKKLTADVTQFIASRVQSRAEDLTSVTVSNAICGLQ